MSKILDANTLIHFLTNDDPQKAKRVEGQFETSPESSLILLDLVFAEVVWVLTSLYKYNKSDITEKLQSILTLPCIAANKERLSYSLLLSQQHNIDFIDAYVARIAEEKNETIYSFDRDFDKIKSIKRLEP